MEEKHTKLTIKSIAVSAIDEWAERAVIELGLQHMVSTPLHPRTAEKIQEGIEEHAEYLREQASQEESEPSS